MNTLTLKSPAKVNLYLEVLNKRADGFHSIETVFERLDLCDEITFKKTAKDGITIKCAHPHVPCGPKNLVHKVAVRIQKDFGISAGVTVTIKKNIPVAAGLAGGSSNAATTLLALNQLWNIGLSKSQLDRYAADLGSDINFFLNKASFALGTDRGQVIQKLNIRRKLWHIVVVPKVKVYAKDVYQSLSISPASDAVTTRQTRRLGSKAEGVTNVLTKKKQGVNILIHHLEKGSPLHIAQGMSNDLQQVVIGLCPKLEKLQKKLKSLNAKGVMVSGSGPAVFGLTDSQKEAQEIKRILTKTYSQVYVTRTL